MSSPDAAQSTSKTDHGHPDKAGQHRAPTVRQPKGADSYRFHGIEGGFRASNPDVRLRATIDPRGVRIELGADGQSGQLRLRFARWGRAERLTDAGDTQPRRGRCRPSPGPDQPGRCFERIELRRGPVTEWWQNQPAGLEQGWTIAHRPAGHKPLTLEVAVSGAEVAIDDSRRSATLTPADANAVHYAGLYAYDRKGRRLDAWMEAASDTLRLRVDDSRATYPVVVDPTMTAVPTWTAGANQADALFGQSVAGAGDVDGDGFGDVVVGAPRYDGGKTDQGKAYVFLGSASGVSSSAVWTAKGGPISHFGEAVAGAGDIDGDGFDDVVIGSHVYDGGQSNEGKAYLYFGAAAGPISPPGWTFELDQADAHLGKSVAGAGDVNDDGFDDLLIGAILNSSPENNEGKALLFLGSNSGPSSSADWSTESNQIYGHTGNAVAGAGDVNGDGFDDIIVAANLYNAGKLDEGRVSVFFGSASGPSPSADWRVESNQAKARFGRSVAGAGDVNGDGFDDVLVGAHFYDNGQTKEGKAFLYLGSPSGPSSSADWTAEGNQAGAHFGTAVAGVGDTNGDGFDDVVIGADEYTHGQPNEGKVYLYLGSSSGLASSPAGTAEANQDNTDFGDSVGGEDINGDGLAEILVGAPNYNSGQSGAGGAFLYQSLGADNDQDGWPASRDCNDSAAAIHPRADEICNGADDDCDGTVDKGLRTTYYADSDSDGFGDPSTPMDACSPPAGYVPDNSDCDDSNDAINPDAPEVCDTADNNCNGSIDTGCNCTSGDTRPCYGGPSGTEEVGPCTAGVQTCVDGNWQGCQGSVMPAGEVCDGADNDCDGDIDEDAANCGADELCYGGSCVDGCSSSAQCPADTSCYRDPDRCVPGACVGVECSSGQRCYAGTCFQSCTGNTDCDDPDQACYDQRCATNPCDGVQCSTGQACYKGTCFETCGSNADCSNPDQACYDERCATNPCDGIQCAAGRACYGGTCFQTCTGDTDCDNPDQACYDQRCATDPCDGIQCSIHQACYSGTCFATCAGSAGCPAPNEVCIDGACTARGPADAGPADAAGSLRVTGGKVGCTLAPTVPPSPPAAPWLLVAFVSAGAAWRVRRPR